MVLFYKIWKKYNEILLIKNKIDLDIRKMTNHPPSPAHKYTVHHPQTTNSPRDTVNNTLHMVFEGELAVKLHAKDVEVRTSY